MYFDYDNLEFRYEPYPIGLAKPLMASDLYREFLTNYPALEQFDYLEKLGHKYSLSEHFNPRSLKRFVKSDAL